MWHYVTEESEVLKYIEYINNEVVGIDLETRGLDPLTDDLLLVQIAYPFKDDIDVLIIDARFVDIKSVMRYFNPKLAVFHNAKFDIKFLLKNANWCPENSFDTMLSETLLVNGIGKQIPSLKDLVLKYFNQTLSKEIRDSFQDQVSYFSDQQLNYAADDAIFTLRLYPVLEGQLISKNSKKVADLEFKLVKVLADMELCGVEFSEEVWKSCVVQAEEGKLKSEFELRSAIKFLESIEVTRTSSGVKYKQTIPIEQVNLNSPSQVGALLAKLGIPVKNTSFDELSLIDNPIVKLLSAYRKFQKKISTYGYNFIVDNIHPVTRRIHTNFNQLGAQSGRLSSDHPNLQNIPNPYKDPDETINYRKAFIATC